MNSKNTLDKVADEYTKIWTKGPLEDRQKIVAHLSGQSNELTQSEAVAIVSLMALRMGWFSKADLAEALWDVVRK